jgi:transcriptional regulator with GAF, ATPase, and Fis domain
MPKSKQTNTTRVSLAELSNSQFHSILKGNSTQLNGHSSPSLEELTECLTFSPGDGRIWLNDQRMLLMHSSSFGFLRQELIERLGRDQARRLLSRTGYHSGARDAELVRQRWPDAEPAAIFIAGAQLHGLEGVVKVEPVYFEFDETKGTYTGEFYWHNSCESEEHIASYGIGNEPVCWMELGYAIGYVSGLIGSLVIFREIECKAMGHHKCKIIGKSANLWPEGERELDFLNESANLSAKPELLDIITSANQNQQNSSQIIGVSATFTAACHALSKVAKTQATVLFSGESGVGKELFATMLHKMSTRSQQPFIAFNCAAIPDNLLEAELFGVEKGAYTGASNSRPGRFERAHGGTLFLDELGTLSLAGQSKLLRALQEKEIERVGGIQSIKVDVRVIAATNLDLREAVKRGEFREDLFYRLNVFPIALPPLRERREDIPLLFDHFMQHYCKLHNKNLLGITRRASKALLNYDFPGNVRELQNIVERGVISADDDQALDFSHLFRNETIPQELVYSVSKDGELARKREAFGNNSVVSALQQVSQFANGSFSLDEFERMLLEEAVQLEDGNLSAAARKLGISRAQLAYRLKKFET